MHISAHNLRIAVLDMHAIYHCPTMYEPISYGKNMYVMFDPDCPKNRLVALPRETLNAFRVLACLIQMARQPLNS